MISREDIIRQLLTDRTKLLAYIRAIVLSHHAAEDIHQDVFVSSVDNAEKFTDEAHLLAWTRRVAKMRSIDYLRKMGRQPKHVDPGVLDLLEKEWESNWDNDSSSMSAALNDCLQELTPRSQAMIALRYTEKLSGAEISQQLGLKLSSVYMSLSRIYHTLSDCVQNKITGLQQQ